MPDLKWEVLTEVSGRLQADLLKSHKGDVTRAAGEAQLPRGTLYRLFKKYAINPSDYRGQ